MTRKVVVEYTILPMASVYANSEDLIVAISEETKTAKTKRSAFRKARAAGGAYVIRRYRRRNGSYGIRLFEVE